MSTTKVYFPRFIKGTMSRSAIGFGDSYLPSLFGRDDDPFGSLFSEVQKMFENFSRRSSLAGFGTGTKIRCSRRFYRTPALLADYSGGTYGANGAYKYGANGAYK
jgi:hypothetical protein